MKFIASLWNFALAILATSLFVFSVATGIIIILPIIFLLLVIVESLKDDAWKGEKEKT